LRNKRANFLDSRGECPYTHEKGAGGGAPPCDPDSKERTMKKKGKKDDMKKGGKKGK
jgi:hypothetical protein